MKKLSRVTIGLFRSWGAQGGRQAAANMTKEQRTARAKAAVTAREEKRHAEKRESKDG